jgi:hypothetical protein
MNLKDGRSIFPRNLGNYLQDCDVINKPHLRVHIEAELCHFWLCSYSCGLSPAYHRRYPGSSPGQVMWYLWWTAVPRQVFSKYLSFPCHSFIPLIVPQPSSSIIWSWYNRPINGRSNSGLGSTPALYINKKCHLSFGLQFPEEFRKGSISCSIGTSCRARLNHVTE